MFSHTATRFCMALPHYILYTMCGDFHFLPLDWTNRHYKHYKVYYSSQIQFTILSPYANILSAEKYTGESPEIMFGYVCANSVPTPQLHMPQFKYIILSKVERGSGIPRFWEYKRISCEGCNQNESKTFSISFPE